MSRRSWVLFLAPVLIWSTTFYAITLQLGSVTTPTYAVAVRFGIAATLLLIWLVVRREPIRVPLALQGWVALSGICSYGISYVLTYVAEETIPSGLVAIAFTLMVFFTPAFARIAYGTPITFSARSDARRFIPQLFDGYDRNGHGSSCVQYCRGLLDAFERAQCASGDVYRVGHGVQRGGYVHLRRCFGTGVSP
jgi:hypothetical protein